LDTYIIPVLRGDDLTAKQEELYRVLNVLYQNLDTISEFLSPIFSREEELVVRMSRTLK
jgi:hypothetical protein